MDIKKMNDDWYLAEKMLPVVDAQGHVTEEPFCFSLERIKTEDDKNVLKDFIGKQRDIAWGLLDKLRDSVKYASEYSEVEHKPGAKDDDEGHLEYLNKNIHILASLFRPINAILQCLRNFKKSDVWVVYVSDVAGNRPERPLALQSLEEREETLHRVRMMVAVATHGEAPFQLFEGIFSNALSIRERKPKVKGNLSIELLAFAAKAMKERDATKIYVIMKPLEKMRDILMKKLGVACMVGANNEQGQSPIKIESAGGVLVSFKLAGPDGLKIIFQAREGGGKHDILVKHAWLFDLIGQSKKYPYVTIELDKLAKRF
jgi:hypothetical protein